MHIYTHAHTHKISLIFILTYLRVYSPERYYRNAEGGTRTGQTSCRWFLSSSWFCS